MKYEKLHTLNQVEQHKVNQAALQAFLAISEKWNLKQNEQRKLLGDIPRSTYHLWRIHSQNAQEVKLPKDVLERISYILGIYKSLHILLPNTQAANDWVAKPNFAPLFNGQTALDKMLAGNVVDLADVRRYLDAQRG